MFATTVVPALLTPCSTYSPNGNCPLCTLVNPKSAIGVPTFSSKSIAPPSVLVSLKNLPVLATVLVGSPVTLLSPAKTTLACASACTLKMFIALPCASSNFICPVPNTSVV